MHPVKIDELLQRKDGNEPLKHEDSPYCVVEVIDNKYAYHTNGGGSYRVTVPEKVLWMDTALTSPNGMKDLYKKEAEMWRNYKP